MPFLGSALGLTAVCILGWGNLVAFDWNDLPVGREFDCKFLKKVKSPPYALCEGEKILQIFIDVTENPKSKDIFVITGRVVSETAVNNNRLEN